jgi:hypothetical protein
MLVRPGAIVAEAITGASGRFHHAADYWPLTQEVKLAQADYSLPARINTSFRVLWRFVRATENAIAPFIGTLFPARALWIAARHRQRCAALFGALNFGVVTLKIAAGHC